MKKNKKKLIFSSFTSLIVGILVVISILSSSMIESFANEYPKNLWDGTFPWDKPLTVENDESNYIRLSDISNIEQARGKIIRIDNAYDLYLLSRRTSPLTAGNTQESIDFYLSASYVLGNDIDYSQGYLDYGTFMPIGYADIDENGDELKIYPFRGVFDGQGFEIRGLTLANYDELLYGNQEDDYNSKWLYYSMFCYNQGTIKNLGIVDVETNLDYRPDNMQYASSLVGKNLSGGRVEYVYVRDIRDAYTAGLYVLGGFKVGGIIAINEGYFDNAYISTHTVVHVYAINSADFEPVVFGVSSNSINSNLYYDDIYGVVIKDNDDYIFDEPSLIDGVNKVSYEDLVNRNEVLTSDKWFNNISHLKETDLPLLQGDFEGNGLDKPYLISNAVELVNFPRLLTSNPSKYQYANFKIVNDIDMRSVSKDAYVPSSTGFGGYFNGNEAKMIKYLSITSGLLINGEYLVGMFTNLILDAKIENLRLYKPQIKLTNTNEYYGSKLFVGLISAKTIDATIEDIIIDGKQDEIINLGNEIIGEFAVGSIVGSGTGNINYVSTYGEINLGDHPFEPAIFLNDVDFVVGGIIGETLDGYINLYRVINHATIIGLGYTSVVSLPNSPNPVRIGGILGYGQVMRLEYVSNHGELFTTSEEAFIYQVRMGGVFGEIYGHKGSDTLRNNIYNKGELNVRNVNVISNLPNKQIEVSSIGISNINQPSIYQLLISNSDDNYPITLDNSNGNLTKFVYNLGIHNIGGDIKLSRIYNFANLEINTTIDKVLVSPIYYSELNVNQNLDNIINYGNITINGGTYNNLDVAAISLSNYTNYNLVHNNGNITLSGINYSGSTLTVSGITKILNNGYLLTNSYNSGNITVYPFSGTYELAVSGIVYQNLSLISDDIEIIDPNTTLHNQIRLNGKSSTGVVNVINEGTILIETNTSGSTLIGGIASYNFGLIQDAGNLSDLRANNINSNLIEGNIHSSAHENTTTGKVYVGGIAAIGGNSTYTGGRIYDSINSGNLLAKTRYLAMAGGILASTKANQIFIRYCLNYGNVYAFATTGRNLPSSGFFSFNYRPAPAARSGGVIASGNCTITNFINHGEIASNDAAAGAIAVVETISGVSNNGVVMSSMVNYGYVKSINSVNNNGFNFNLTYDDDSVYSSYDSGWLVRVPRALGGFIGNIWAPGNWEDDLTLYEFILNTDEKVNMVGRIPALTAWGFTSIPNVDTSRMYTTNLSDNTQSPFSNVRPFANSNLGIYNPNFAMRREKELQNYIFYLPNNILGPRFEPDSKYEYGMYVLANSAGREHGSILPVNINLTNLTPLIPNQDLNVQLSDTSWRENIATTMLLLHQNKFNHQTKLYDLILSDNTWLNVEGGTILEWDDIEGASYYYAYMYEQEYDENGELVNSTLLSGYPRKVTSGLDLTKQGLPSGKYKIEIQAVASTSSNYGDSLVLDQSTAEFEIFEGTVEFPDRLPNLRLTSTSVYWKGNGTQDRYIIYIYRQDNQELVLTYNDPNNPIYYIDEYNRYVVDYSDFNLPNGNYYISVQNVTNMQNMLPSPISTSYLFNISGSEAPNPDELDVVIFNGQYITWTEVSAVESGVPSVSYNLIIYETLANNDLKTVAYVRNVSAPINLWGLNLPQGTYQAKIQATVNYSGAPTNNNFRKFIESESKEFVINKIPPNNLLLPDQLRRTNIVVTEREVSFLGIHVLTYDERITVTNSNADGYLIYVYNGNSGSNAELVTGYPLFMSSINNLTIKSLYLLGGDNRNGIDYHFVIVPLKRNNVNGIDVYAANAEIDETNPPIVDTLIYNTFRYILINVEGNGHENINPSVFFDSNIDFSHITFNNVNDASWYSVIVYDESNQILNGFPRQISGNAVYFNQLDLPIGNQYKLKVIANNDYFYSSPIDQSTEISFSVVSPPGDKPQNTKPVIYTKIDWDFTDPNVVIPESAYIESSFRIYDLKEIEYFHSLWRDDDSSEYKIQYSHDRTTWLDLTEMIIVNDANLNYHKVIVPESIDTSNGIYLRFITNGRNNRIIIDDIQFYHDRSGYEKVNETKNFITTNIKNVYNQNDVIVLPSIGSFNTLIEWSSIGDNASKIDLNTGRFAKSDEPYTISLVATITEPKTNVSIQTQKDILVNPFVNYGLIGPIYDVENMDSVNTLPSSGAIIDSSSSSNTWSTNNVSSYNKLGLANDNYSLVIGNELNTGSLASEFKIYDVETLSLYYGLYEVSSSVSYNISYSYDLISWFNLVSENLSNESINNGRLYSKVITIPEEIDTSSGIYIKIETLTSGGLVIDDLSFSKELSDEELIDSEKLNQSMTSLNNLFIINYNMFDAITLWKHGSYETTINWKDSNGNLINDDYLFLEYQDESYTMKLTAELSINELILTKEFDINVIYVDQLIKSNDIFDGENLISEDLLPLKDALIGRTDPLKTWSTLLAYGYNEDYGRYNGDYAIRIGSPAYIAFIYDENGNLVSGYPREILEGVGLDELGLPNGNYTISMVATGFSDENGIKGDSLFSNHFEFTINDSAVVPKQRLQSIGVSRETKVLFNQLENAVHYLAFIYDEEGNEVSGSPIKIDNGYDIATLKLPNGKYQIEIIGVADTNSEYMDSIPSQRFDFYIFGSNVSFDNSTILNVTSINYSNNILSYTVDEVTENHATGYYVYVFEKDEETNELRNVSGSPYFVEKGIYSVNLNDKFPNGNYVFGVKAIGNTLSGEDELYLDSQIITTDEDQLLTITDSNIIKTKTLANTASSSLLTNPNIEYNINEVGTNGTGTVVYRISEDAYKHIVEDSDEGYVLNNNVYAYYVIYSKEVSFNADIKRNVDDGDYYFELKKTSFNNYIMVPIGELIVYSELYLKTLDENGSTPYEDYKTTYKVFVEVLPSSDVNLTNVNIDGLGVNFESKGPIYTLNDDSSYGKKYQVDNTVGVRPTGGYITLTFSVTNCQNNYSILNNFNLYFLNSGEYEVAELDEIYSLTGGFVNNNQLTLTISMKELAKGGNYRIDFMLYGTKVHHYQVDFYKLLNEEAEILDLEHIAMSNLNIESDEVNTTIDLGVLPEFRFSDGNYIIVENNLPSYLSYLTISPYASIGSVELVNVLVNPSTQLITYTINIEVIAENSNVRRTWTHQINEKLNNPFIIYKNGNPVDSKNLVTEREEAYTLFTIDLGLNNDFIADYSNVVVIEPDELIKPNVKIENHLVQISFYDEVPPISYEYNFVYHEDIQFGTFNLTRNFVLVNYDNVTKVEIIKRQGINSLLLNVSFMPSDTGVRFPTIYSNTLLDRYFDENGIPYYYEKGTMIPKDNNLEVYKNGIIYRDITLPLSNHEFTINGYVEDFNTDGLLPRFTIPNGAKIYKIENGVRVGSGAVDDELLRGDFMPDEDQDEKYIDYVVVSEDGNYETIYHIAVEDVKYTISFILNITYQLNPLDPSSKVRINDLTDGELNAIGLSNEVMFISFKNLLATYSSTTYNQDNLVLIDGLVNQMTSIYRFKDAINNKSYYNYNFARNSGGTYAVELVLPKGYSYQVDLRQTNGEIIPLERYNKEFNINGHYLFVKPSVRPRTYTLNINITKGEFNDIWGIIDRIISWK